MNSSKGFSVVELLVAIVVISILAAITIVSYNGIQERAHDTAVQGDMKALAKLFELHALKQQNGTYPSSVAELNALNGVSIKNESYLTDGTVPYNLVTCYANGATSFSITAITKSGKRLYITDKSSVQEYTGTTSWLGDGNYTRMCESTLPGSTHVSLGSGYGSSAWREWTRG